MHTTASCSRSPKPWPTTSQQQTGARAEAFLVDADYLLDTVGPGPYQTRALHMDVAPDSSAPFCAGLVINDWIVVFPPGDHPDDAPPSSSADSASPRTQSHQRKRKELLSWQAKRPSPSSAT